MKNMYTFNNFLSAKNISDDSLHANMNKYVCQLAVMSVERPSDA